jgi:hypothetical protein
MAQVRSSDGPALRRHPRGAVVGNIERSAREVAGDMPRETFEKAVEAAAKAVCAHRSYRMIAAEVLASVNHAGAVSLSREQALWLIGRIQGDTSATAIEVRARLLSSLTAEAGQ